MERLSKFLSSEIDGIFFTSNSPEFPDEQSYLFSSPGETIVLDTPNLIPNAFQKIEEALSQGYHVAGYFSYELGYFLDDIKFKPSELVCPLLDIGIYDPPVVYTQDQIRSLIKRSSADYWAKSFKADLSSDHYKEKFKDIMNFIRAGDTYQVNFTFRMLFEFFGSPVSFWFDLLKHQSTSYSVFARHQSEIILSLSPELFFRKTGQNITVKPMKGTSPRGITDEENANNIKALTASEKSRAENLMIVDLVRNDLGRVCLPGSVSAPRLFDVETYETLHQMTSTIQGSLRDHVGWLDLFKAIFPCGSVTGAPKIRTMQIIHDLESNPRGIYTGALGFINPDKTAVFNIPIRTVTINTASHQAVCGIGSGITADSDSADEYDEGILKAKFLTRHEKNFQLIETMRWDKQNGYFLLDEHLKRIKISANYFNIPFDCDRLIRDLDRLPSDFAHANSYKIRILLDAKGGIQIFSDLLWEPSPHQKVTLSGRRVNSKNIFLSHKSTNRCLYDEELKQAQIEGCFDVIFINENNQITEGAVTNIFVKMDGIFYTPPLSCGLLNGTFRSYLLSNSPDQYKEKVLYLSDLPKSDGLFLCNSVRGIFEVQAQNISIISV